MSERATSPEADGGTGGAPLSDVLSSIGHEVRGPLSALGQAATLLELVLTDTDPRALRALEILRAQANRLEALADRLRDVARALTGRLEVAREPLDLREVVAEALARVEARAREREQRLDAVRPERELPVRGDRQRLVAALVDLLDNALDVTPEGAAVQVDVGVADAGALVRVRDSGPGLPAELGDRVFAPFVQGPQHHGLGVGLTLARASVVAHGGSLALTRAPEGGTEARLWLPTPRPDAEAGPGAAADDPGIPDGGRVQGRRVLVVEDYAPSAELLALLLREAGHEVEVATSGEQALERCAPTAPDVALVDLGLPGIDGYEVARRIRKSPGGDAVTLVALTGHAGEEVAARTREAGFDHHVVKSASYGEVLSLVGDAAV